MDINFSYDDEFCDLIAALKEKYGEKLFELDGIGKKQLDINAFSKKFYNNKTTAADISVDSNSNITQSDIITYNVELPKAFFRLNAYFILWKKLKQLYGEEESNRIIERQLTGDFYINDFHGLQSCYCFNYSTYDIALLGLPMVTKIKSIPPKHLYSFKSQLEQFVVYSSNSTLGAVGLADVFITMSYYIDKMIRTGSDAKFKLTNEEDVWIYVKENIVSLIYTLNQPFRGGHQSAFTNVSIFDDNFLNELIPGYNFVDENGEQVIPKIETVKKTQEIFLDVMNEELFRTPVTFPVTTACISVDENNTPKDQSFIKMIAEKNKQFGFINIYCGKTSTLSSCCFTPDTKILAKTSNGVKWMTFEKYHNLNWEIDKKNPTIFHNGSWCKGKSIKIPYNKDIYKITTANNKTACVTDDHIHPTLCGNKPTTELTTNDYLLFNNIHLDSFPEKDMKLTHEQGYLIGLYLGDGSKYKRATSESYEITFSMGIKDGDVVGPLQKALTGWDIDKKIHTYLGKHNVLFIKIYSKNLYNIINEWVYGNYAYEKELNMGCLLQSIEFRQGILDGWYKSDGGNSNRIYSTSEKLIECGELLITSLGKQSIINVSDRTGEITIHGETFNRNYKTRCIRWYATKNKRSMKNVYIVKNNSIYFKINLVEVKPFDQDEVYCFEMKNEDEPYFTLPNGMITHNCRLRSDTNNEYFNAFGAGSSKIGSLGVVTTNLPRLAIISKTKEKFMENLKELVTDVARINNAKRHIIRKRIEVGASPLYSLGFMSLKKQYSTFGITGLNEAVELLGYNILEQDGQQFVIDMLTVINKTNDKMQKQYEAPHNCEQTPAENSGIKLSKKDNYLKYTKDSLFYSNQFVPLIQEADMLDRIKLQGLFDSHFSGGSILHINVEEQINDTQKIVDLINTCAKMGVVYWAINYNLQMCEADHMTIGANGRCPMCGKPIKENFTRVVGFLTNIKNWNVVRRELDYPNRQFYKEI